MNFINKQVGSWQLVQPVGHGSYGSVYRANHIIIPGRVGAVKLLRASHSSEADRETFLREARVLGQLNHKYLLEILDAGFDTQGEPFLVSRYAPGGSLAAYLRQQEGHLLSPALALKVLNQVGEALIYAHQRNVIHRDLKPANILFNETNDAVLSDFGLATTLSTGSVKLTGVIGTPIYMAPEQFIGIASKETDQYALGCLAYELVTGHRVFDASSPYALAHLHTTQEPVPPSHYSPNLPAYIELAILRALAKQREMRYPGIEAFLRALNNTPNDDDDVPPTMPSLVFPAPVQQPERKAVQPVPIPPERKGVPLPVPAPPERQVQDLALEQIKLSNVLAQLEASQKKLEVLAQAALREPNNAGCHVQYGRELYTLQRYEEARQAFERAVDLQPRHGGYLHWMGLALYQLKRYDAALEAFRKSAKVEPQSTDHVHMQNEVLNAQRKQQQAPTGPREAANREPKPASSPQPTTPAPKAQPVQTRPEPSEKNQPIAPARKPQNAQNGAKAAEQKAQVAPPQSVAPAKKSQPTTNGAKAAEQKPPAGPGQPAASAKKPPAGSVQPEPSQPKQQPTAPAKKSRVAQSQPKVQTVSQPPAASAGKAQAQPKAPEQKPQNQAQAVQPKTPAASNEANTNAMYQRGMALYKNKVYTLALTNFERAVLTDPRNSTYHIGRGRALASMLYYDQALAAFDEAIRLNPNNEEAPRHKAEVIKAQRESAMQAQAPDRTRQPKRKRRKKKKPAAQNNDNKTVLSHNNAGPTKDQAGPFKRFIKRFLS